MSDFEILLSILVAASYVQNYHWVPMAQYQITCAAHHL